MSAAGLAEARRRMVQHGESEEAVLAFERSYAELEDVIATGSGGDDPGGHDRPARRRPVAARTKATDEEARARCRRPR